MVIMKSRLNFEDVSDGAREEMSGGRGATAKVPTVCDTKEFYRIAPMVLVKTKNRSWRL